MGGVQSMYHNIVPAGKNERGEWFWTNAAGQISRDCDWPAVINAGKYKMWYRHGILDRPHGGPVFESFRERIHFKDGVPHDSDNWPAIWIEDVTPIFDCIRDCRCDCQNLLYNYDYEYNEKNRNKWPQCRLLGFDRVELFAHTIPDLSKYCSELTKNTMTAELYYTCGKLSKKEVKYYCSRNISRSLNEYIKVD